LAGFRNNSRINILTNQKPASPATNPIGANKMKNPPHIHEAWPIQETAH